MNTLQKGFEGKKAKVMDFGPYPRYMECRPHPFFIDRWSKARFCGQGQACLSYERSGKDGQP